MALMPDAVSTNEELVETFLDRVYHPHKKAIWAGIVALFAVVITYLGMRQHDASRRDDMQMAQRLPSAML